MDSVIKTSSPAGLFGPRIMHLTAPKHTAQELSVTDRLAAISDPLERTHFIRKNKKALAEFVALPPQTSTLSSVLVNEFKALNASLSQTEIAELLSCSHNMISDVLAGRRNFSGKVLLALSRLTCK